MRKIELKRRKKERLAQGIFDMPGRHRLVGRVSKYEKGKKLERMLYRIDNAARTFWTSVARKTSTYRKCSPEKK